MKWKNTFINAISLRRLTKNIQITHIIQHRGEKKNLFKKWAEDLNRNFSKENTQMADRHMKRCSTSSSIQKIHTKTAMR